MSTTITLSVPSATDSAEISERTDDDPGMPVRNDTSRVAYNTIAQVAGRIAVSCLGLVTLTLTTRYLGATDYGQLATALIFVGLFASLTDAGITSITVRELSQNPTDEANIVGSVLLLRFAICSVAALSCILLGRIIYSGSGQGHARDALLYLSVSLFLATIQTTVTGILIVRLRSAFVVVGDIFGRLCTVLFTIAMIRSDRGFNGIIIAMLAGYGVNFCFDMYFGLAQLRPRIHIDKKYTRSIVSMTLPLAAAGLINTIYFRADSFLISVLMPSREIGIYGIAYKVLELTMSLPIIFMGVVYPILCRNVSHRRRLRDIAEECSKVSGLVAAPITAGVIALSVIVSRSLGGPEFERAAVPMSILMVANYFAYFNAVYAGVILADNQQRKLLKLSYLSVGMNLAMNLFAIPRWGIVGSAVSVMATEGIQLLLMRQCFRRCVAEPEKLRIHAPAILIAAAMGVAVHLVSSELVRFGYRDVPTIVVSVLFGVIFYGFVAGLTGQFKKLNINGLKAIA